MDLLSESTNACRCTCTCNHHCLLSHTISQLFKKIAKQTSPDSQKTLAKRKKDLWTSHEDAKLLKLVDEIGKKWAEIGKTIGGRTGKQVRERYLFAIGPGVKKEKWTQEEDSLLISLYQKYGSKWHQLAQYFPGRHETQLKNRFSTNLKNRVPVDNSNSSTALIICQYATPSLSEVMPPLSKVETPVEFSQNFETIIEMGIPDFNELLSTKDYHIYDLDWNKVTKNQEEPS